MCAELLKQELLPVLNDVAGPQEGISHRQEILLFLSIEDSGRSPLFRDPNLLADELQD